MVAQKAARLDKKMKYLTLCLCLLIGCATVPVKHDANTSFEVVCYNNSSTDCLVDAGKACGPHGFRVLHTDVRVEGRANPDFSGDLRITMQVACKP